ncbi:basic proline-rich protein-like [Eublepharis macularius]|uniref:Basic proline-rich protein-like n=1 Tax=Eublepharis macularius TaxID=481883 RepID=A0AA97LC14_EUBMA|nr:basic proline-rich protein-like [Eublepharis macularius]
MRADHDERSRRPRGCVAATAPEAVPFCASAEGCPAGAPFPDFTPPPAPLCSCQEPAGQKEKPPPAPQPRTPPPASSLRRPPSAPSPLRAATSRGGGAAERGGAALGDTSEAPAEAPPTEPSLQAAARPAPSGAAASCEPRRGERLQPPGTSRRRPKKPRRRPRAPHSPAAGTRRRFGAGGGLWKARAGSGAGSPAQPGPPAQLARRSGGECPRAAPSGKGRPAFPRLPRGRSEADGASRQPFPTRRRRRSEREPSPRLWGGERGCAAAARGAGQAGTPEQGRGQGGCQPPGGGGRAPGMAAGVRGGSADSGPAAPARARGGPAVSQSGCPATGALPLPGAHLAVSLAFKAPPDPELPDLQAAETSFGGRSLWPSSPAEPPSRAPPPQSPGSSRTSPVAGNRRQRRGAGSGQAAPRASAPRRRESCGRAGG